MAEKLYFDTSEANNLDKNVVIDSTVATPSNVKSNYVFKDAETREPLVGTMTINPDLNIKINPSSDTQSNSDTYTIPEGYHSGNGKVYVGNLSEYTPGNATPDQVVNNKVFWVNGERLVGTLDIEEVETTGTATASDIAEGKTAWVNKQKITGILPRLARKDQTLKAGESYTIPEGISAGTTVISAATLASQTVGTATDEDILYGETAYVNGEKLTGKFNFIEKLKEYLSTTDAKQNQVLSGKKFYSSKYEQVVSGTMTDHTGESSRYLNLSQTYAIPEGYYDGITAVKTHPLSDYTEGTAVDSNILINKIAWVNGEKITGTMPLNQKADIELDAGETYTIPKGYHIGQGTVTALGLIPQTPGTATAENILLEKTAWVNGEKITGTMPNVGAVAKQLSAGEVYTVPKGYHTGGGSVWAKSIAEETPGDATADTILIDKIAWANGEKIVGTMTDNANWSKTSVDPGSVISVPSGYHNGGGTISVKTLEEVTPATAIASDVLSPKTAWVNGEQITGTLELSGTAALDDVVSGKTFYNVNAKEKLTGTLTLSGTAMEDHVLAGDTFYTTNPKQKLVGSLTLTGDAVASQVLAGSSFYNTNPLSQVIGTMTKNNKVEISLDAGEVYTIPEGYHPGTSTVTSKSLPAQTEGTATKEDIILGETAWVNGEKLTGTLELTGNATSSQVVEGYTFYSDNAKTKLTGAMINAGAIDVTIYAGEEAVIPIGYHNGQGVVRAKDLASQTQATAGNLDILENKTAWVNGTKLTGTMANNGSWSSTNLKAGESVTIPSGYHSGSGSVHAASLASQTEADAVASNLLSSKTAWVNGEKITGTMTDSTGWSYDDLVAGNTVVIPEGYHDGTKSVKAKDLASQTVGDALAAEIISGKIAWVNGQQITGSMADNSGWSHSDLVAGDSITIPAGYHDGSHKVTAKDLASQTVGTAGTGDILEGEIAWANGVQITGSIARNTTSSIRIYAGHSTTIPSSYLVNDLIIYSIHTDILDLTGTDAEYDSSDLSLVPNTSGYVDAESEKLVIVDVPI